ncbi:MAG: hypothetical protein ACM3OO_03050 [Planctomycetaceae bacterium]
MRRPGTRSGVAVTIAVVAAVASSSIALAAARGPGGGGGGGGHEEAAPNNLSFPVLWAEGVAKDLPGTRGMAPILHGAWWYQWGTNGTEPNVTPAACQPDPDDQRLCDDGIAQQADPSLVPGQPPADDPMPLARAYLQHDPDNVWRAASRSMAGTRVDVDAIDWGDNLESKDWTTSSHVRTEVVLLEDRAAGDADHVRWPLREYAMRHTSGWGIDEVQGLEATDRAGVPVLGPGTQATVYSNCARLTIQRLDVPREDPALATLVWVAGRGWRERAGATVDLVRPPLFDRPVWEAGDGPRSFSAEINVKGKVIYGYTWNLRRLSDSAGDYRITFSLDPTGLCPTTCNTFFVTGVTSIIAPSETEAEGRGGGTPVLVARRALTFVDVRIEAGTGGGGPR